MNLCFVRGKIISDIEFQFIIGSKHISACYFRLELENKSVIKIKSYDKLADFCYRNLTKGGRILLQGSLNHKMEIILFEIQKF